MRKKILIVTLLMLIFGNTSAQAQTNPKGELDVKQFAWVGKLLTETKEGVNMCTATYIGNRWVITAAHCVNPYAPLPKLTFGGDLSKGGQVVEVDYVLPHGGYNPNTLVNDIALLHLERDINVSYINLPPSNDSKLLKSKMYTIGFGRNEKLQLSGKLMYNYAFVDNRYASNSTEILASYRNPVTGVVSTTCMGDSGGPLVASGKSSILLGVASAGAIDCDGSSPSSFTRVSSYLKWIQNAKSLINKELAKKSDFEKILTPNIEVRFTGNTPFVYFKRYSNLYFYNLTCYRDYGDKYSFSSWEEIVQLPNYTETVTFGCVGVYVDKDGKQSTPSRQIIVTIPAYRVV